MLSGARPFKRICVHVRRAQKTPAAKVARRAVRLAKQAVVFSMAPSMASDAVLKGDWANTAHEATSSALAAVMSTALYDAWLVLHVLV